MTLPPLDDPRLSRPFCGSLRDFLPLLAEYCQYTSPGGGARQRVGPASSGIAPRACTILNKLLPLLLLFLLLLLQLLALIRHKNL